MSEAETSLDGGWQTDVTRAGDVVFRSPKPQSATVIALLQHFADVGCTAAPHPIDSGFTDDGREQLSYIEGVSPHPRPWSDDAAFGVGRLVRSVHDAAATFVVPDDATWRSWFARDLRGTRPIIGHCDAAPWNVIARNDTPVALIDWDYAGPIDAVWEVADVAWMNAQLYDDDVALLNDLGGPDERARQVRLILDGYELERADREGFVDKMIEMAIRSARQEAIDQDIRESSVSPDVDGFPLLWAMTWRTRAAAWMLDHRTLLERALR